MRVPPFPLHHQDPGVSRMPVGSGRGGEGRGQYPLAALKAIGPDVCTEGTLCEDGAATIHVAAVHPVPAACNVERDGVWEVDGVVHRKPDVHASDVVCSTVYFEADLAAEYNRVQDVMIVAVDLDRRSIWHPV